MGNLVRLLLLLPIFIACAKNLPVNLENGTAPGGNGPFGGSTTYISGTFLTTDNQTILVNDQITKPLVMIFSQDTCLVCRAETKMLVEKFQGFGSPPLNVDLYTVLVGAIMDDALDFKGSLSIQWKVGFQQGDSFFRSYCPGLKVPCVVVQTPQQGFVFQKTGEFQIEDIEKYTGGWTY